MKKINLFGSSLGLALLLNMVFTTVAQAHSLAKLHVHASDGIFGVAFATLFGLGVMSLLIKRAMYKSA